jgi:hypothetical protein
VNLAFCLWLAASTAAAPTCRSFHEPYFYFTLSRPWRNALAIVQRMMAATLLQAASTVYLSTMTWSRYLRAVGVLPAVETLPIPSSLPATASPASIDRYRREIAPDGAQLVGHFGTYGEHVASELVALLPVLAARLPEVRFALAGAGSVEFLDRLRQRHPRLAASAWAAGRLDGVEVSAVLRACDLLVQPYPDGITTRRTSVMAGLKNGVATVSTAGSLTEPLWNASGASRSPLRATPRNSRRSSRSSWGIRARAPRSDAVARRHTGSSFQSSTPLPRCAPRRWACRDAVRAAGGRLFTRSDVGVLEGLLQAAGIIPGARAPRRYPLRRRDQVAAVPAHPPDREPLARGAIAARLDKTHYDVVDIASAEGLWIGVRRRSAGTKKAFINRSNGLEHLNYRRMLDDHDAGSLEGLDAADLVSAHAAVAGRGGARLADRLLLLNEGDRRTRWTTAGSRERHRRRAARRVGAYLGQPR